MRDLRMFAWIGDTKYPYPTDEEIGEIARAGYTVIQMHRLGTPGEPRPPAGELERVIKTVHRHGMLFLWTENADLMYNSAPGVQEMKSRGNFNLWQGFNYGGRYTASMDPYCDLIATCLASPNGLAEYRLATYENMFQRFEVDGIYLDDNLAYENCTLWNEHKHPQRVYDCLIELHEMNWRRREYLRQQCPHAVIVSHNTKALVLPVICDFDAVLYGEGYSFDSLTNYWNYYRMADAIPAQGMIWPGGEDPVRCPAALAYNYELLTGGGQYCQIDWRWFTNKFSYGKGVMAEEATLSRFYNLAQQYFGFYESKPLCFADSKGLLSTTTPLTHATLYHNTVWDEQLVVVANMSREHRKTSLQLGDLRALGISADADYALLNIGDNLAKALKGGKLNAAFSEIDIPAERLQLFLIKPIDAAAPYHLWGGKRLSSVWQPQERTLKLKLHGPDGLEETVLFGCSAGAVEEVTVNGMRKPFAFDPTQGLIHGAVKFGPEPLEIEVRASSDGNKLPLGATQSERK